MAKLRTLCAAVLQSSITLPMPLLSWQAPWILDDSSKHESHKFMCRIAHQFAVWWETASADQQAVPDQGSSSGSVPNGSAAAEALISVEINGHRVQVCPQAALGMPWHCSTTQFANKACFSKLHWLNTCTQCMYTLHLSHIQVRMPVHLAQASHLGYCIG